MEALRQVVEINNNQLNFSLSVNFKTKYAEVIILPFFENYSAQQKKELLKEEDWENLPEDLKVDILKSIKEADNGELIPHEVAMKRIKEKYNLL